MSHHCKNTELPADAYGPAITECWEAPQHGQDVRLVGTFWVGNGEYWSMVNFCPLCGAKAPVPVHEGASIHHLVVYGVPDPTETAK